MSTSKTSPKNEMNREAWLHALALKLAPLMKERHNLSLVHGSYKLSVGFPSVGGRATRRGRIGECWHIEGRHTREIFVHPKLGDPVQVAETVLHELIHAALPAGVGHKKPFSQAAKALGLLPPGARPTATFADEEMKGILKGITDELGPYPHEALDTGRLKPARNPLIKVMCPICGRKVRDTRKWLDESGATICSTCDVQMQEADVDDQPSAALISVNSTHEYKVPIPNEDTTAKIEFDPRWTVMMSRTGRNEKWYVIDYGEYMVEEPIIVAGQQVGTRKVVNLGAHTPKTRPALSREDALNLLEALRAGLMTDEEVDKLITDREDQDFDNELPEEDDFLDEDEEETPDYPEDQPEDEDEYEATQRAREAAGASASDAPRVKVARVKEEREIGSFQYRWSV